MNNSETNSDNKWKEFFEEFNNESPRGAVLIAIAYLDSQLQEILENFIIDNQSAINKIFEFRGNLSNFHSKIDFAYQLGLLEKEVYKELETLNTIRNKFAHEIFTANFDNQDIIKHCNKLKYGKIPIDHITKTAQNKFIFSAAILIMRLGIKSVEIKRKHGGNKNDS